VAAGQDWPEYDADVILLARQLTDKALEHVGRHCPGLRQRWSFQAALESEVAG
jgi:hypothetical protein